ncbi:aminopeptidase P family protein [Candidatus Micrarchaeota archaeon]|nr:aminopeptidase P family protein [Candidatus Micrarchaeota archaeon]
MDTLLYMGESFNPNFYYYTGIESDHSFFLKEKNILFTYEMNYEYAKKNFEGKIVLIKDPIPSLKKYVKKELAVDLSSISVPLYKLLQRNFRIKNSSQALLKERGIKKPTEVKYIKKASELTNSIFNELDLSKLKTEKDVEKKLLLLTLEKGLEPAFPPIVSTGINTSFPHSIPTKKKLSDFILIDYGVKYKKYCSDFTRIFFLKPSKKQKEIYQSLQNIFHEIADELPCFKNGSELTIFSKKLFKKYKIKEPPHAIGHGIGLEVHEYPSLGSKSRDSLKNTAMAIEPATYLKKFGMRYERTLFFNGKKARIF